MDETARLDRLILGGLIALVVVCLTLVRGCELLNEARLGEAERAAETERERPLRAWERARK